MSTEKTERGKHMGRMDMGVTDCGLIVMAAWDDGPADREAFIRKLRKAGYVHRKQERYEGDPMPEWAGNSHCDNEDCQCHALYRRFTAPAIGSPDEPQGDSHVLD